MGNVQQKQEYTLVNNPINSENIITVEKSVVNQSLQKLISDVSKLNDINNVFKNYDNETILDYYKSDSIIEILKLNNDKSLQLANALPVNKEKLIFRYFPIVPVNLIIAMSKNIDFNVLDNKESFLFKKLKKGEKMFSFEFNVIVNNHLKYITTLLENIDHIDVNLTDKYDKTFFESLISQGILNDHTTTSNLIQSLKKQKYNFNKIDPHMHTFLTQMLTKDPKMTFDLSEIMKLKSFNIATESRWLYFILTKHLDNIHNYIIYMFKRDDYVKLFYELYNNLYIDMWNDKFVIFIRKAMIINVEKTIECLNYKTNGGNTIIHLIAASHDKCTLQFVVNNFRNKIKIEPNNKGETPLMLYNENSFKTILQ